MDRDQTMFVLVMIISLLIVLLFLLLPLSHNEVWSRWNGPAELIEDQPASSDTNDAISVASTGAPADGLPVAQSGRYAVQGPPSLTAGAIDTILQVYHSPATGTGQVWVSYGQRYGIDPIFALAFFVHESQAGTHPNWAGLKPDGSTTHNVGNIICAGYAQCYQRFRDYPSWEEGIHDWYRLIAVEYIQGRGATTVEQIIPIYAPALENDVAAYIATVKQLVDRWRADYQS